MSEFVPEGWSHNNLSGSGIEILDGDRGKEYPKENEFYDNEYCLFLSAKNVTKNGFKFNHRAFITREKDEALRKGKLLSGDIVITTRGTVGSIAFYDKSVPYTNIRINSGMAIIRNIGKLIDSIFLNQLLYSSIVTEQLDILISGSAQPQLTIGIIKNLSIPLPPLPEQQKIAAILTSVDEVIEKTQAQINKLKDLKTGMMQELLTRGVGVDGKPHTEFKDSPVGRIPKGWKVAPLEELVKNDKKITYGIVQAGPHYEGGVPYIRVSDMSSRHLTKKGVLLTSPEIARKFERSSVRAGDIVYALRGMIGHVHIVPSELNGANLTQGTARISPSENINTNYLLWAMRSPYVALQNDLEAKGSTFKEVTLASLRQIHIAVPSGREQQCISSSLSSIESRIYTTEDKLNHLKALKKALMQDLLTGKVRVKVDSE